MNFLFVSKLIISSGTYIFKQYIFLAGNTHTQALFRSSELPGELRRRKMIQTRPFGTESVRTVLREVQNAWQSCATVLWPGLNVPRVLVFPGPPREFWSAPHSIYHGGKT